MDTRIISFRLVIILVAVRVKVKRIRARIYPRNSQRTLEVLSRQCLMIISMFGNKTRCHLSLSLSLSLVLKQNKLQHAHQKLPDNSRRVGVLVAHYSNIGCEKSNATQPSTRIASPSVGKLLKRSCLSPHTRYFLFRFISHSTPLIPSSWNSLILFQSFTR